MHYGLLILGMDGDDELLQPLLLKTRLIYRTVSTLQY